MFESNTFVFRDLKKSLREIIAEEKGMVTLDSQFKSIDIRDISDNYRFIGGKEQCTEFIKKSLASMPQERCVNKTIQRTYRREDIPDAVSLFVKLDVSKTLYFCCYTSSCFD